MTVKSVLGQDTGSNGELDNGREARVILKMITTQVRKSDIVAALSERDVKFLEDMIELGNAVVTHWRVSGKQLFWMRDIKDKLIDKGLL